MIDYINLLIAKSNECYQAKINKDKGPSFIEEANGNAYIETYTVINDREGPSFSILFGRLNDGSRFIANTPNDKDLLLDMMTNDYLNIRGKVEYKDNINIFKPM